mmetsp:Transcript_31119/g.61680  ORF Transcript_31119/g.61680 Transcript_31119/m.61680 type:complete len:291 (+) Transcript_31119:533-1405(+)
MRDVSEKVLVANSVVAFTADLVEVATFCIRVVPQLVQRHSCLSRVAAASHNLCSQGRDILELVGIPDLPVEAVVPPQELVAEKVGAHEKQNEKENKLVGTLEQDIPPHGLADQRGISQVRLAKEEDGSGLLSTESEGSHGVHDKVHPKHHDGVEGRGEASDTADEDEQKSDDVHGELELEEPTDVVVDAATPEDGADDGTELVVGDDDVAGVLGNLGSGDTHTEADIAGLEGGGVVGSVPCDADDLSAIGAGGLPLVLVPREKLVLLSGVVATGVQGFPLFLIARESVAI